jgi:predicted membrane protein
MPTPIEPFAPGASASTPLETESTTSRVHFPCLMAALLLMLVGSIYPLLFTDASGKADHGLAMAIFWAMSSGLVRGVGFVPRLLLWRWSFSGWACLAGLALAALLRWGV